MAHRTVTVGWKEGLHARPAAQFRFAVVDAGIPVTIATDGKDPVDAASMLAVMTLGVECGQQVTVAAEGEQADLVLDKLAQLLTGARAGESTANASGPDSAA